jgi:hypothetical protein
VKGDDRKGRYRRGEAGGKEKKEGDTKKHIFPGVAF